MGHVVMGMLRTDAFPFNYAGISMMPCFLEKDQVIKKITRSDAKGHPTFLSSFLSFL